MIFSPAEAILFVALVVTSGCVVVMYRKLGQLSELGQNYRLALRESATALSDAHAALALLNGDSRILLTALCLKIDEAESVLGRFERTGRTPPPSCPK